MLKRGRASRDGGKVSSGQARGAVAEAAGTEKPRYHRALGSVLRFAPQVGIEGV